MPKARIWFKGWKAGASADALIAAEVVAGWRRARATPGHMVRAILIYAALLRGDTEPLAAAFPWVRLNGGVAVPRPQPMGALQILADDGVVGTIDDFLDGLDL